MIWHNGCMIVEERWSKILNLLDEKESLQVKDIAKALHASEATIRRDITSLAKLGKLTKVHGGILKSDEAYVMRDLSMVEKQNLHPEEKRLIGKYASTLIQPNDFVYLDAGTTTEACAEYIQEYNATYVTNSIPIAHRMIQKGFRVIVPGGEVKTSTEALIGAETVQFLERYHFTIGFFGTNGVNQKNGFTTPELNEASVKQKALEHTKNGYVLCDHSKFSVISPIMFGNFNDATIITDVYPKELGKRPTNVVEVKKK